MKILIIRHAEPDYENNTITEKGWREAHMLAERLAKLPISEVFVSPMGRAQHTAQPYLELTGKSAQTLDWLHEFRGRVWDEEKQKNRCAWNMKPRFWNAHPEMFDKDKWLENELMSSGNVEEVWNETIKEFDAILEGYGYKKDGFFYRTEQSPDTTIAFFCHFGLGMALVSHLSGVALPMLWQSFFMPASSVTTMVTEERVKGEVFFKCMQMGDTSHLYANDEPVSKKGLAKEFYEEKTEAVLPQG